MSNDISKIMGLSTEFQKNHEFKSLLKYIISLKNYQEFDFKYTNRIWRTCLTLKIYKNRISRTD